MGLRIRQIIIKNKINNINYFNGKKIACDMSNILYQFLTAIRKNNGDFIKNKDDKIISHLYGLFFRICFFIKNGILPIFVFDGTPPSFKSNTLKYREYQKKKAEYLKDISLLKGKNNDYIKYLKRCSYITDEIIYSSKSLLKYMGIPFIQSPSEGEAQAAHMEIVNDVDFVLSQDYDTMLFGAENVIRNLTVYNKNQQNSYEILSLSSNLNNLGITREQFIDLCICIGTDFNEGFPKVGCKTALKLIKKYSSLKNIYLKKYSNLDIDIEYLYDVKNFFLNPPVLKNYQYKFIEPKYNKLIDFLCYENNFEIKTVLKYCNQYHYYIEKYFQNIFH